MVRSKAQALTSAFAIRRSRRVGRSAGLGSEIDIVCRLRESVCGAATTYFDAKFFSGSLKEKTGLKLAGGKKNNAILEATV